MTQIVGGLKLAECVVCVNHVKLVYIFFDTYLHPSTTSVRADAT